MNRTILVVPAIGFLALTLVQACSDDETPAGSSTSSSSSGETTSSSSGATSSGASNSSSSSGEPSSADTCSPAGGACVCGPTTAPCPSNGAVRDGTKKCAQGPQGSGACFTTCCVPGDAGALPPVDSGSDADADAS